MSKWFCFKTVLFSGCCQRLFLKQYWLSCYCWLAIGSCFWSMDCVQFGSFI